LVQAVLFDLYGTLIDIRTDEHDMAVHGALARFLSYLGLRTEAEELKAAFFGDIERLLKESGEAHPEIDVAAVFEGIIRRLGKGACDRAAASCAAALFRSLAVRRLALFPGVREALSRLTGLYACGCVTDAQRAWAEAEIAMLGLEGFFRTVVISSRLGFRKPDPRMFLRALADLGAEARSSVYIGDDPERDLAGARRAGMRCILFGAEDREYNGLRPDATFRDYRDLPGLIEEIGRDLG